MEEIYYLLEVYMELKDRLKAARKYARLTQVEVAEKTELSQGSYSQLERGLVKSTSKIVELAELFGVNPSWLSTGAGEMLDNYSINGVQYTGDNYGNVVGGNQFNMTQSTQPLPPTYQLDLDDEKSRFLKDLPVLDIDMGVKFALDPSCIKTFILDNNQKVVAFVPHSDKTFGVQLSYDIEGTTPSILLKNDILIFEPCMRPRDNDLVLLCVDYQGSNRGLIARLYVELDGKRFIKHNTSDPVPMPFNSLICGVAIGFKRRTMDNSVLIARLEPDWNILDTLNKEVD